MTFAQIKAKFAGVHKSWTVWFNTVGIPLIVTLIPYLQENLPAMQEYMSDNLYKNAMFVIVAGNIALRFKTNSALEHK